MGMCIYVWAFNSISLINVSIFMTTTCCFCYYSSVIQLGIGKDSEQFIIVQDCSSFPGFLFFPSEAENCSFKVCEELCWDFDGDCIESVDFFC